MKVFSRIRMSRIFFEGKFQDFYYTWRIIETHKNLYLSKRLLIMLKRETCFFYDKKDSVNI